MNGQRGSILAISLILSPGHGAQAEYDQHNLFHCSPFSAPVRERRFSRCYAENAGFEKTCGGVSGTASESTEVMKVTTSLDYERKAGLELRIPEPAAATMASAKRSAAAGWEVKNRAGSINSSSMMRNWSWLSTRSIIPSTRAYSVGGTACTARVAHSSTGAGGSAARDRPPKSLCTRKSPGFGVLRTA